jgi:type VI protein secretion system component Hcp
MAKGTQFLKFVGEDESPMIEGESFDEKHLREIDLVSWGWNVKDPQVPQEFQDGSATDKKKEAAKGSKGTDVPIDTSPAPSELEFVKFTDRATTALLQAMDLGTKIPKVILTIEERFPGADSTFHLQVVLKDGILTSFNWTAQAEGAGMTFNETWTLKYSKVDLEFELSGSQGAMCQEFGPSRDPNTKSPPTAGENQDKQRAQFAAQYTEYQKTHPQKGR